MRIEKKTMSHGALLITAFVSTALLFLALICKNIVIKPATNETRSITNSLIKYPLTKSITIKQDKLNIFLSLFSSFCLLNFDISYVFRMFFRKYINKTVIVATKENRLGINIRKAYSTNPIPKKSAETMLTKLLTING